MSIMQDYFIHCCDERTYRVAVRHADGVVRYGLYTATSRDEARTMAERHYAGEEVEITSIECLD